MSHATPNPVTLSSATRTFDWSPANTALTYTIKLTGTLTDTRTVSKDFSLTITNKCASATISISPSTD